MPKATLFDYLKDIGDGSIGRETPDCSVVSIRTDPSIVTVSTTDFFYPSIEDPYMQGQIAACNVLSDIYAMGVNKVDTLLMILGVSREMNELERKVITSEMIRGFNDKAIEANTSVTGGQSVMNPWPIIGGVAIAVVKKRDLIKATRATAGQVLVLTKPLGTQIASNVAQWCAQEGEKWQKVEGLLNRSDAERMYDLAVESMSKLNLESAKVIQKYTIGACTDVTGFGILGHAENLAVASKLQVSFIIDTLPVIKGCKEVNENVQDFKLGKGLSAETSGGLLIAVNEKEADDLIDELKYKNGWAWKVGRVEEGEKTARMDEFVKYIEV